MCGVADCINKSLNGLESFFEQHSAFFDGSLSIFTLLVAIIAVAISVSSLKSQKAIALYEERYKVYAQFSALIQRARIITIKSLTEKGFQLFWFCWYFNIDESISSEYASIFQLKNEAEALKDDLQKQSEINKEVKSRLDALSVTCYKIYLKDSEVLLRSKLLFSKEISEMIELLTVLYEDTILIIGEPGYTSDLAKRWSVLLDEIEKKKILEKMRKTMRL